MNNNLKKNIKSGILFTSIDRYGNIFLQLLTTAIIARLLSPEEFGVIAIVMVFVGFFNMLSEMGIGAAIVQRQDLNEEDISVIFNLTFFTAIVFASLFWITGYWLAEFYNRKEYILITHSLSLVVLFSTLNIVPRAYLEKKQNFKILAKINLLVSFVMNGLCIVLAFNGWSYYAILVRSILNAVFIFILSFYFAKVKILIIIKREPLNKILKFSIFLFLYNLFNYFGRSFDNLIVGKELGTRMLGIYEKAYSLMLFPLMNLGPIVSPVLNSALASYQNDKKYLYHILLELVKFLSYISIFISLVSYFCAYEIIYLFYGEKWIGVVETFKILSTSMVPQVLLSLTNVMFQLTNKTDLLFLVGGISSLFTIIMIVMGIQGGKIETLAIYLVLSFCISFIAIYWFLIKIILRNSIKQFLYVFIKPIVLALTMGAFLNLNIYSYSAPISLVLKIIVSVIIFVIFIYVSKEKNIVRFFSR